MESYIEMLAEISNMADAALEQNPCECGGAEECETCMRLGFFAVEAAGLLRHFEARTPYVRKVVAVAA